MDSLMEAIMKALWTILGQYNLDNTNNILGKKDYKESNKIGLNRVF